MSETPPYQGKKLAALLATTQHVHVEVVNGLSTLWVRVDRDSEARLCDAKFTSRITGQAEHFAQ